MSKYFVIYIMVCMITSAQADYIFELASEYEVEDEPWQAICLDAGYFNDDAYSDVAVAYYDLSGEDRYLYTFLGNGDCTFDMLTTDMFDYPLGSITVNDFDNDGYDDLLIGEGYTDGAGSIFHELLIHMNKGNGDGTFTELDTLHVTNVWVTSGDLNDDGNNDLVVSGFESGSFVVSVKLGNGDFTFQETASYETYPILHTVQILGDMNLDGNVDIGVLCLDGSIQFLYGNGDGTFQPPVKVVNYFPCGPNYCFMGSGDFDEDGFPDFVATCGDILAFYDVVFLWCGAGYGQSDSLTGLGQWVEVEDFNLDGHLDIAISAYIGSIVYPGYGNGSFSHNADSLLFLNTEYGTYGMISEDFDLDGDFDLIISEHYPYIPAYIRCYQNTTINLGFEEQESGSISDLILEISPNPFSTSVTVSASGFTSNPSYLQIFDLSGRLVTEIEPVFSGNDALYQWNGRSETGSELPDGIYSARLSSDNSNTGVTLLKLE
jgi:hypothetical protein